MAGNLVFTEFKGVNGAGNETMTMMYDKNRLTKLQFSTHGKTNDLEYFYGQKHDGINGAGRVVEIKQGDDLLVENYEYDAMGNVSLEKRVIRIPNVGLKSFETRHTHDSWGRVQEIVYPDQTSVTYGYRETGELNAIDAERDGVLQAVLKSCTYDGLGNLSRLVYGNDTQTDFTYNQNNQKLTGVSLMDKQNNTLLDKSYSYNAIGNVSQVVNNTGPSTLCCWSGRQLIRL